MLLAATLTGDMRYPDGCLALSDDGLPMILKYHVILGYAMSAYLNHVVNFTTGPGLSHGRYVQVPIMQDWTSGRSTVNAEFAAAC